MGPRLAGERGLWARASGTNARSATNVSGGMHGMRRPGNRHPTAVPPMGGMRAGGQRARSGTWVLAGRQGLLESGLRDTKGWGVLERAKIELRPVGIGLGGPGPDTGVASEEGWCYRPAAKHRTAKIAGEQHDPLPQQCDRAAPLPPADAASSSAPQGGGLTCGERGRHSPPPVMASSSPPPMT